MLFQWPINGCLTIALGYNFPGKLPGVKDGRFQPNPVGQSTSATSLDNDRNGIDRVGSVLSSSIGVEIEDAVEA
jgi:hypothetical protein